jgi:hypothetical protein
MTADDQVGHIWLILNHMMNGVAVLLYRAIMGCDAVVGVVRMSRCISLQAFESQRSAEASRFLCRDLASARRKTPCQLHQHTISNKHQKERFIYKSLTPSNIEKVIINSPLCEEKIISHFSTILLHEHVAIQGPRTHHRHVVYSRVP